MDGALTRAEHIEFAKRMEDEHNRQNKRIAELEKAFNQNTRLLVSVEKMATNMEAMQKEQVDQGERLEKLESKSGEKWDKFVGYVISAIVGGVVTFMFAKFSM